MTIPLTITAIALGKLMAARTTDGLDNTHFVRASISGGGCAGMKSELCFDSTPDEDDFTEEFELSGEKITIAVDNFSALYMKDVTLDYVTKEFEEGFKFIGSEERKHCACGSSFR